MAASRQTPSESSLLKQALHARARRAMPQRGGGLYDDARDVDDDDAPAEHATATDRPSDDLFSSQGCQSFLARIPGWRTLPSFETVTAPPPSWATRASIGTLSARAAKYLTQHAVFSGAVASKTPYALERWFASPLQSALPDGDDDEDDEEIQPVLDAEALTPLVSHRSEQERAVESLQGAVAALAEQLTLVEGEGTPLEREEHKTILLSTTHPQVSRAAWEVAGHCTDVAATLAVGRALVGVVHPSLSEEDSTHLWIHSLLVARAALGLSLVRLGRHAWLVSEPDASVPAVPIAGARLGPPTPGQSLEQRVEQLLDQTIEKEHVGTVSAAASSARKDALRRLSSVSSLGRASSDHEDQKEDLLGAVSFAQPLQELHSRVAEFVSAAAPARASPPACAILLGGDRESSLASAKRLFSLCLERWAPDPKAAAGVNLAGLPLLECLDCLWNDLSGNPACGFTVQLTLVSASLGGASDMGSSTATMEDTLAPLYGTPTTTSRMLPAATTALLAQRKQASFRLTPTRRSPERLLRLRGRTPAAKQWWIGRLHFSWGGLDSDAFTTGKPLALLQWVADCSAVAGKMRRSSRGKATESSMSLAMSKLVTLGIATAPPTGTDGAARWSGNWRSSFVQLGEEASGAILERPDSAGKSAMLALHHIERLSSILGCQAALNQLLQDVATVLHLGNVVDLEDASLDPHLRQAATLLEMAPAVLWSSISSTRVRLSARETADVPLPLPWRRARLQSLMRQVLCDSIDRFLQELNAATNKCLANGGDTLADLPTAGSVALALLPPWASTFASRQEEQHVIAHLVVDPLNALRSVLSGTPTESQRPLNFPGGLPALLEAVAHKCSVSQVQPTQELALETIKSLGYQASDGLVSLAWSKLRHRWLEETARDPVPKRQDYWSHIAELPGIPLVFWHTSDVVACAGMSSLSASVQVLPTEAFVHSYKLLWRSLAVLPWLSRGLVPSDCTDAGSMLLGILRESCVSEFEARQVSRAASRMIEGSQSSEDVRLILRLASFVWQHTYTSSACSITEDVWAAFGWVSSGRGTLGSFQSMMSAQGLGASGLFHVGKEFVSVPLGGAATLEWLQTQLCARAAIRVQAGTRRFLVVKQLQRISNVRDMLEGALQAASRADLERAVRLAKSRLPTPELRPEPEFTLASDKLSAMLAQDELRLQLDRLTTRDLSNPQVFAEASAALSQAKDLGLAATDSAIELMKLHSRHKDTAMTMACLECGIRGAHRVWLAEGIRRVERELHAKHPPGKSDEHVTEKLAALCDHARRVQKCIALERDALDQGEACLRQLSASVVSKWDPRLTRAWRWASHSLSVEVKASRDDHSLVDVTDTSSHHKVRTWLYTERFGVQVRTGGKVSLGLEPMPSLDEDDVQHIVRRRRAGVTLGGWEAAFHTCLSSLVERCPPTDALEALEELRREMSIAGAEDDGAVPSGWSWSEAVEQVQGCLAAFDLAASEHTRLEDELVRVQVYQEETAWLYGASIVLRSTLRLLLRLLEPMARLDGVRDQQGTRIAAVALDSLEVVQTHLEELVPFKSAFWGAYDRAHASDGSPDEARSELRALFENQAEGGDQRLVEVHPLATFVLFAMRSMLVTGRGLHSLLSVASQPLVSVFPAEHRFVIHESLVERLSDALVTVGVGAGRWRQADEAIGCTSSLVGPVHPQALHRIVRGSRAALNVVESLDRVWKALLDPVLLPVVLGELRESAMACLQCLQQQPQPERAELYRLDDDDDLAKPEGTDLGWLEGMTDSTLILDGLVNTLAGAFSCLANLDIAMSLEELVEGSRDRLSWDVDAGGFINSRDGHHGSLRATLDQFLEGSKLAELSLSLVHSGTVELSLTPLLHHCFRLLGSLAEARSKLTVGRGGGLGLRQIDALALSCKALSKSTELVGEDRLERFVADQCQGLIREALVESASAKLYVLSCRVTDLAMGALWESFASMDDLQGTFRTLQREAQAMAEFLPGTKPLDDWPLDLRSRLAWECLTCASDIAQETEWPNRMAALVRLGSVLQSCLAFSTDSASASERRVALEQLLLACKLAPDGHQDLAQSLRTAVDKGVMSRVDVTEIAAAAWKHVHGAAESILIPLAVTTADAAIERLLAVSRRADAISVLEDCGQAIDTVGQCALTLEVFVAAQGTKTDRLLPWRNYMPLLKWAQMEAHDPLPVLASIQAVLRAESGSSRKEWMVAGEAAFLSLAATAIRTRPLPMAGPLLATARDWLQRTKRPGPDALSLVQKVQEEMHRLELTARSCMDVLLAPMGDDLEQGADEEDLSPWVKQLVLCRRIVLGDKSERPLNVLGLQDEVRDARTTLAIASTEPLRRRFPLWHRAVEGEVLFYEAAASIEQFLETTVQSSEQWCAEGLHRWVRLQHQWEACSELWEARWSIGSWLDRMWTLWAQRCVSKRMEALDLPLLSPSKLLSDLSIGSKEAWSDLSDVLTQGSTDLWVPPALRLSRSNAALEEQVERLERILFLARSFRPGEPVSLPFESSTSLSRTEGILRRVLKVRNAMLDRPRADAVEDLFSALVEAARCRHGDPVLAVFFDAPVREASPITIDQALRGEALVCRFLSHAARASSSDMLQAYHRALIASEHPRTVKEVWALSVAEGSVADPSLSPIGSCAMAVCASPSSTDRLGTLVTQAVKLLFVAAHESVEAWYQRGCRGVLRTASNLGIGWEEGAQATFRALEMIASMERKDLISSWAASGAARGRWLDELRKMPWAELDLSPQRIADSVEQVWHRDSPAYEVSNAALGQADLLVGAADGWTTLAHTEPWTVGGVFALLAGSNGQAFAVSVRSLLTDHSWARSEHPSAVLHDMETHLTRFGLLSGAPAGLVPLACNGQTVACAALGGAEIAWGDVFAHERSARYVLDELVLWCITVATACGFLWETGAGTPAHESVAREALLVSVQACRACSVQCSPKVRLAQAFALAAASMVDVLADDCFLK
jgi:hypothetical protein